MRRGVTLVELVTVVTLIGVLAAMAGPRLSGWLDRLAVRHAVDETVSFYQTARFMAIARGSVVRVEFGPHRLAAVFEDPADSVFLDRPGPARDRVDFASTRPVARISPNGLGLGGANATLRFRRGDFEERLTLSRLGRLKRWR